MKPDVFDTAMTLKQGQDHQTCYESVDHKQGHDHTKFERLHLNCVQLQEKASVKGLSNLELYQLSPLNTSGK